jgi:uncharacterized protein
VKAVYNDLLGRHYTASDGRTRQLALEDFLFIAPSYNAQVRALQAALPNGARVGSVDKFQGQEAKEIRSLGRSSPRARHSLEA